MFQPPAVHLTMIPSILNPIDLDCLNPTYVSTYIHDLCITAFESPASNLAMLSCATPVDCVSDLSSMDNAFWVLSLNWPFDCETVLENDGLAVVVDLSWSHSGVAMHEHEHHTPCEIAIRRLIHGRIPTMVTPSRALASQR